MNKLQFISMILAASCGISAACHDSDDVPHEQGALSLRVEVGTHAVDVLHYELVRPGDPALTGDFDVSGVSGPVSAHIGGIPVGDGYTITLSADTIDGQQECAGVSEAFVIGAGVTTSVRVVVSCHDVETTTETTSTSTETTSSATNGDLSLDVPFNSCPELSAVTAASVVVAIGASTDLTATATDEDGDTLTFTWSESGVTFASGSSASYLCAAAGSHKLDVTVTDTNCMDSGSVTVDCI